MADEDNGGQAVDLNAPEIKAAIDAAVADQVKGLKSKNGELIATNKTIKSEFEAFKTQFDGLDMDAVKGLLSKAQNDEETRLLAAGKIDEVLNKRTEAMRAAQAKELKKRDDAIAAFESRLGKRDAAALGGQFQVLAAKAGLLPEAIDDAIMVARTKFTLNDDGNVVAREGEFGTDGEPIDPAKWLESLREAKPHWWPRATGTGASNNGSGAGASTAKSWKDAKTPAERAAYLMKKNAGRG